MTAPDRHAWRTRLCPGARSPRSALRSFLTLLGIAVGIAAVILLTSIGEGIHRFVLAEFTSSAPTSSASRRARPRPGGASPGFPAQRPPADARRRRERCGRLPHIIGITPCICGNAEVKGNGRLRRTLVYGVTPELLEVFNQAYAAASSCRPRMRRTRAPSSCSAPSSKHELFGADNALGAARRASAACSSASSASWKPRDSSSASTSTTTVYIPAARGAGALQPRRRGWRSTCAVRGRHAGQAVAERSP